MGGDRVSRRECFDSPLQRAETEVLACYVLLRGSHRLLNQTVETGPCGTEFTQDRVRIPVPVYSQKAQTKVVANVGADNPLAAVWRRPIPQL